eukprot:CAMPEP_0197180772 /NCGR_PEP_ID=MMETSP1423-20130617/5265_1 /TAXON_ID=476441 /ORGANISM="Pseudo-nitzschia heimii, Strain UNC1101" /LENGTH=999 /DNA_ID=CAMNT_0042630893 /DNA_START=61 /DNA_END=3057 /DNA_ORIENTATION=+
MGVPAFFRWLTEKYPKVLQDVVEERVMLVGGEGTVRAQFDCTRPNPSGLECDNLYIDMNGIIHPCSHPEHGPQPTTEEEMYENVCHYVDRLFRIMRPRKLLYLAIDGVAPRAKMNQQRSRRFRSAQEARENLEVEENIRKELTKNGQKVPSAVKAWDSNVITPGTPFMLRLAEFIRFYIRKRISTDKAWQKIRVIFSDASIPGEGEHKIMSHIRLQRSQPGYSPNLVHVLHGLDADLIMLALATHEAHFYISREEVMFGRKSQEMTERRQNESGYRDKQRHFDEMAGDMAMQLLENKQKPICRVSIPILREYLAADFAQCIDPARITFTPSLERLIDDIVFLCFFVGNDFLPHLPSLDIRDGALDYLFNVYKRILPSLGDYITNHGGQVNLSNVDVILAEVGSIEDYVFTMKYKNEVREKERREQFNARKKLAGGRSLDDPRTATQEKIRNVKGRAARILEKQKTDIPLKKDVKGKIKSSHMKSRNNLQAAIALKKSLQGSASDDCDSDVKKNEIAGDLQGNGEDDVSKAKNESDRKRKFEEVEEQTSGKEEKEKHIGVVGDIQDEFDKDDDDGESTDIVSAFKERVKNEQKMKLDEYARTVEDKVRLHEKGWKDRYYSDKCKADDVANHGGRNHLFRSYVVGLCWVMKYYYEGCPSWKWYYPFHYAPFASDLRNVERFQNDAKSFELVTPFSPVEQLMAVLPSDSSHAIPKEGRWLMSDLESPIIDFYPTEVPVDPNGKAMPWLWVVLLPFIDEERLLAAMAPTMSKWSKKELLCNARGLDDGYIFLHSSHPLAPKLKQILQNGKNPKPKYRLNDAASYGCPGFTGFLRPPLHNETMTEGQVISAPKISSKTIMSSEENLFTEDISENNCICVAFSEPAKLSHKSIMLPGSHPPPPSLNEEDKRICRPRLNRGGQSIAFMGGSDTRNSHRSGHGSMNISSYEREIAQRNGRGHDLNRAGTRTWGSFEPTPKRQFRASNPFQRNGNGIPPPAPPQKTSW